MPGYVDSMMFVGQTPWHGIGVPLDALPSAEEAIQAVGLNWKVLKQPIFTPHRGLKKMEEVPCYSAVVRKDRKRFLGVVGKTWQPLQNQEGFRFFDPFIQAKVADCHAAGSLKDGSQFALYAG